MLPMLQYPFETTAKEWPFEQCFYSISESDSSEYRKRGHWYQEYNEETSRMQEINYPSIYIKTDA